jgi:hypothetical protein
MILGGLWKPLLAVLGAAGVYVKGACRRQGEGRQPRTRRHREGQEAARKGRAEAIKKLREGKTPEEIVRGNDDAW